MHLDYRTGPTQDKHTTNSSTKDMPTRYKLTPEAWDSWDYTLTTTTTTTTV